MTVREQTPDYQLRESTLIYANFISAWGLTFWWCLWMVSGDDGTEDAMSSSSLWLWLLALCIRYRSLMEGIISWPSAPLVSDILKVPCRTSRDTGLLSALDSAHSFLAELLPLVEPCFLATILGSLVCLLPLVLALVVVAARLVLADGPPLGINLVVVEEEERSFY